ncbi:MAG: alkaline phosphatase family protein [Elusimicrobia bacterium]|nr:alkaline phosphatase family protein [Elusimicrobiota bacterium]
MIRRLLPLCIIVLCAGAPAALGSTRTVENAVLIGWDGAQRSEVLEMLAAGELPNLGRLVAAGGMTDTLVTTGATETKPGWAEILTGRNAELMGIKDNVIYRPIPPGYTIFELLKARIPGIKTVFLAGKGNNVAARGPHEVCVNCVTRMPPDFAKTHWWNKDEILAKTRTYDGSPRRWESRAGEPYFNAAKSLDIHKINLEAADRVGKAALSALKRCRGSRFFAFIHFEEPDEQGHVFKDGSPEYKDAIRAEDRWLGRLMAKLKELGLDDRTAVFVVSDHGFDPGLNSHRKAPYTFLAVDRPGRLRAGDRKDVTPTILETLGVAPESVLPPLDGRSLREP